MDNERHAWSRRRGIDELRAADYRDRSLVRVTRIDELQIVREPLQ